MKTLKNIQSVSEITELEKLGVKIDFTPENEDLDPAGQLETDEDIEHVINSYNSGNEAAWFCAKVEVRFRNLYGVDYLGACSYNSFAQFQSDESGYYVDMINQCIDQINSDIESHNEIIKQAWDIRKAKNLVRPYGLHVVTLA